MSDELTLQVGDVFRNAHGQWRTVTEESIYLIGRAVREFDGLTAYTHFARPCNAADAYQCIHLGQRMECIELPNVVFIGSHPRECNRLVHALVGPYQVITMSNNVFRDLFANPLFRFIPAVPE